LASAVSSGYVIAISELERWASRLFSATSLDEVFAEP
jgi:hypothetical protein